MEDQATGVCLRDFSRIPYRWVVCLNVRKADYFYWDEAVEVTGIRLGDFTWWLK